MFPQPNKQDVSIRIMPFDHQVGAVCLFCAVTLGSIFVSFLVKFYNTCYGLRSIPVVGSSSSSIFSFYYNAFNFARNGPQILQEGYEKHHGAAFKVVQMQRWLVVVSGRQMIDDIRQASDDQLSLLRFLDETLYFKYFRGSDFDRSRHHLEVVRGPLTRNIVNQFSNIKDEIFWAFKDRIPVTAEWTRVPVMPTLMQVIARTSNRSFVGLPLCRNAEYIDLVINSTVGLATSAVMIGFLPGFLRPLFARWTGVPSKIHRAIQMLGAIIEERIRMEREYGKEWEGKPNDLLSWLLDASPQDMKNVRDLTLRILTINFAAIHTTSTTLANALYNLAAYPEYIQPLRDEIEAIVNEHGWNKVSVGKMHKLDSFLKETQRMAGLTTSSMSRYVLQDFTFSDGTTIPAGTLITVASHALHHDEAVYPEADEFQPFRFSETQESSQDQSIKQSMVTPNIDYFSFGLGKHACPGRFFAVNELKIAMAHLLLTYDIKFENEELLPLRKSFGVTLFVDPKTEVLFRARS